MNVALLNGSKHKTIYLSVQLPSKVLVLVGTLNAVVRAVGNLLVSACSITL